MSRTNVFPCKKCKEPIYWVPGDKWCWEYKTKEHHQCKEWKKEHPERSYNQVKVNPVSSYSEQPSQQQTRISSSSNNNDIIPILKEHSLLLQGIAAQLKNMSDYLELISRYTKNTSQSVNTMIEDAKEFKFEKGAENSIYSSSILDEKDEEEEDDKTDIYDELSDTDDNTRER